MGIRDTLKGVGNDISNGVDAVGNAANNAYDWSKNKVQQGEQAVHNAVVHGKIWVDDAYAKGADFLGGFPTNENFPAQINYEVQNKAGPPMPASGAWSATGGSSTLSPAERSFIYLDVGRWGGSQFYPSSRDFGLVCGRTVALCAFRSSVGSTDPVPNTYSRPEVDHINALIKHLSGGAMGAVKVRRYDTARSLLPDNADVTPDRVFVIVGDMHLPVITSLNDSFGPKMGRQPGNTGTSGDMVQNDAIDWYQNYNGADGSGSHSRQGGDIFEQAGPDLTEFVRLLNGFTDFKLHLMQLGDMIDLWIGLERFFVSDPAKVVLDTTKSDPDATTWVNHWTDRTLTGTTQSQHVQNFLGFTNGDKTWLYGNHDNYLGAYNPTQLTQMSGGQPRQEKFDLRPTRLFASHGHKWDSANRDGATSGQAITQVAFSHPWVRGMQPGGRRDTITGAAELFLSNESNPFCVFAMGHTHVAVLTRIAIVNET
jgi:hypothetical protein